MALVIPSQVWRRVIRFSGERKLPGTAFLVDSGDDQLLVTARHLCIDEPEECVLLRHPWTNDGYAYSATLVRVGRSIAPAADFAVFRMTNPIEVGYDVPLASEGLYYTQPAFILGYPYELTFHPRGNPAQQMALVKSCIISGSGVGQDGVERFYIDTIVNPGFSGGPLTYVDQETEQYKFAGVISKGSNGFIKPHIEGEPEPPIGPTGIGIVVHEIVFREALRPGVR
jgi:hypothetical protein